MLCELAFEDATALSELVRAGAVSSVELTRDAIEKIETLNGSLNAVVTPMFEQALIDAERLDARLQVKRGATVVQTGPRARTRARARGAHSEASPTPSPDPIVGRSPSFASGEPVPPFAGVPFLVKDLIASCAGVRQSEGSRFCAQRIAPSDSELVRRLRAAGVVILGKTNTSELGSTPVTENRLFGPTRNPWNLRLSPAGSSGGSAAAVAAGMVAMAHGNDTGGSLRNPASACGVFALKPSRGRMPLEPHHGELLGRLLVEHAITRSVRDSARLLDATHGALAGDPSPSPPPSHPFEDALVGPARRLRIAFSTDTPAGESPDPQCVLGVQRAAVLCEQLGHHVVEAQPALDGEALADAWFEIWGQTIRGMMERLAAEPASSAAGGPAPTVRQPAGGALLGPEGFDPLTWRWYERGCSSSAAQYLGASRTLMLCAQTIAEFMQHYDAWLTPTLGMPTIPIGAFDGSPPSEAGEGREQDVSKYLGFSPFARLSNVTGLPAMSVPLHWAPEGIPVGAHFMGKLWEEGTLLGLAAQLERAAPWSERRPPVSCGSSTSAGPGAGSTPSSSSSAKKARA